MEQIKKAMKIYYFLLKVGELTFENNKDLYLEFSNTEVRECLETMAKESDVIIEKYNQVIYMIPNEGNSVIGIDDMTLQKVISYDARKIDFYISQYIITIIITVFFSGKGSYVRSRDFIRINEVEEIITSRLTFANSKKNIENEEKESKVNVSQMFEHWNSLQLDEEGKRRTKYGYIRRISAFLAKHNLLIYDEVEEEVRPTNKFTNLMTYNFLDNSRLELIKELLNS